MIKLPNWQQASFSYYDNVGDQRLKEINNYVWGLTSNTPLSDHQYTYNPVGTIATWQEQTDTNVPTQQTLTYDAADQLISDVKANTGTNAMVASNHYAYGSASNRLSEQTAGTHRSTSFVIVQR